MSLSANTKASGMSDMLRSAVLVWAAKWMVYPKIQEHKTSFMEKKIYVLSNDAIINNLNVLKS